jgi:hypothetical protein
MATVYDMTTRSQVATRYSGLALSAKLQGIVDRTRSFSDIPIVGPKTAQEARAALREFETHESGTGEDQVERLMLKLATVFPNTHGGIAQAAEKMRLYAELLQDIPYDILSAAFRSCALKHKFFPTVAEIREEALPAMHKRLWPVTVLRELVRRHERDWTPPIKNPMDPVEVKAVLDRVADYPSLRSRRSRKDSDGPEDGGEPDERPTARRSKAGDPL